jgi:hypothetical protein
MAGSGLSDSQWSRVVDEAMAKRMIALDELRNVDAYRCYALKCDFAKTIGII